MLKSRLILAMLAGASASIAGPASARAVPEGVGTFASQIAPLGDGELAAIRGGFGYDGAALTPAAVRTILDAQSRFDFRGTAAIGGVIMDNWWNDYGAQLIVTSLTTPR